MHQEVVPLFDYAEIQVRFFSLLDSAFVSMHPVRCLAVLHARATSITTINLGLTKSHRVDTFRQTHDLRKCTTFYCIWSERDSQFSLCICTLSISFRTVAVGALNALLKPGVDQVPVFACAYP